MTLNRLAKVVKETLDEYIPDPKIPLHFEDPFTLLLAVILSQQCQDKRVNEVTPKLFSKGKTPLALAALPVHEIEALIKPCGLAKRKAEAISRLSKILCEKYGGVVPNQREALESLPGVGRKTASVVLSQAFHKAAFPIDSHIKRVARRWHLSKKEKVDDIEEDLKALFPKKSWGRLHLQMILFARGYCPARGHVSALCPLCSKLDKIVLRSDKTSSRKKG